MISRVAFSAARQCARAANTSNVMVRPSVSPLMTRSFGSSVEQTVTATDAFKKSCYLEINFAINEDSTVYEAVQQFAAFDIGALVTTDGAGTLYITTLMGFTFSQKGWKACPGRTL